MIVIAQWVNCALNPANEPKSFFSCSASSPVGSPPFCGARFCQNSECITWPERWKPSCFSSAAMRVKSFFARASSSPSSALLAPAT